MGLKRIIKDHNPSFKHLTVEYSDEGLRRAVLLIELIGLSAKPNPPKMSELLNMLGPISNGLKRNSKHGIKLNSVVKIVHDIIDIPMSEGNLMHLNCFEILWNI